VTIDETQVRHIAQLAKLELSSDEVARMVRDLDAILGYVGLLQTVATDHVPPTTQPFELETPLRPDRAQPPLSVDDVVRAAPAHDGAALIVPKVLE